MRKLLLSLGLAMGIAGFSFSNGCDETISHEKETKVKSDGTVEKKEEKVVKEADGDIKKTTEKSVDKVD